MAKKNMAQTCMRIAPMKMMAYWDNNWMSVPHQPITIWQEWLVKGYQQTVSEWNFFCQWWNKLGATVYGGAKET